MTRHKEYSLAEAREQALVEALQAALPLLRVLAAGRGTVNPEEALTAYGLVVAALAQMVGSVDGDIPAVPGPERISRSST